MKCKLKLCDFRFWEKSVDLLSFLTQTLDNSACNIKQSIQIVPQKIFFGNKRITEYVVALNGKEMFYTSQCMPFMDNEGKDTHKEVNPLVSEIAATYEFLSHKSLGVKLKNCEKVNGIDMFNLITQKYIEKSKSQM